MVNKERTISLVSFADRRYRNALKRMAKNTEKFPFTERHFCDETNSLDQSYWHKLKPWLYRRGFGYWKWKADIVKSFFDKMSDGDIIVYTDGGIVWNNSDKALERFQDYLDMLILEKPILAFQEPYIEQEWTKGDLLKAVGVYDDDAFIGTNQLWGGCFMLMKSPVSEKFLTDWIALNNLSKELITDQRSIVANKPGFKEHRHDQSTFSLTAKRYPHIEISWKETHVEDSNCLNVNAANCSSPILAKRTKEIGRPKSEIIKNKLLRPWRSFLHFYFKYIRDYDYRGKYVW